MKVVCLLALVAVAFSQEGNLIVRKSIDSEYPNVYARGQNFTVMIDVYNIGDGAAYQVNVKDNWPETTQSGTDAFKLADGSFSASWAQISAGGHETHNFTIVPHFEGRFDGARAGGSYQPTADGAEKKLQSTAMPGMSVLAADQYAKYFAKHYQEWTIFWVCAASTVVVPLFVWGYIQMAYSGGVPKSPMKSQ